MRIDSIGRENSRNDLVPKRGNPGPYDGLDCPDTLGRICRTHEEDNHACDSEKETNIAEPEAEFRRWLLADTLCPTIHPHI